MKRRIKVPKKVTRKQFPKTAQRTHKFNVAPPPMRGGNRL